MSPDKSDYVCLFCETAFLCSCVISQLIFRTATYSQLAHKLELKLICCSLPLRMARLITLCIAASSCTESTNTWSICGLLRGNVKSARRIRSGREQLMASLHTGKKKQQKKTSAPASSLYCTKMPIISHLVWYRFLKLFYESGDYSWKHYKSLHHYQENVTKEVLENTLNLTRKKLNELTSVCRTLCR